MKKEMHQIVVEVAANNQIQLLQDVPMQHNPACIIIAPELVEDIVLAIKNTEVDSTIGTINVSMTVKDDIRLSQTLRDEDEEIIVLHPDQASILFQWLFEAKKVIASQLGYDVQRLKIVSN